MQAGLVHTYGRREGRRAPSAYVLSGLLIGAYVLLYFGGNPRWGWRPDPLQDLARVAGLGSKWTLYGLVYTLAMVIGGVFVLRRHGNSRHQRIRTLSVVAVQIVFAFATPLVLQVFGRHEYYLSYFWPLKIEYLYPTVIFQQPFLLVAWSFLGSLVAFPLLAYFLGKRFYCSWVCGCGGLANTAGEPFRHLSSKSATAWTVERFSIHSVLFLAIVTTAVVWTNWAIGFRHPAFARFAFALQDGYGLVVGAVFAGVLGVGLYPLMGTRLWCRFACPMAALLGLVQRLGRFRISVKRDMCISCGNCSTYCEMGIDVRLYAMANQDVRRVSCVGCGMCAHVCPRGVLRLENRPTRFRGATTIRAGGVDL